MSLRVGSRCPSIASTDLRFLKGDPIAIGTQPDGGKNQVIVVEFWATWCPPCRASIPHLTELAHQYKDKGVVIVGISSDQDHQKAEAFVKQMGDKMDYVVALDPMGVAQSRLYQQSEAAGIPHAFVVDASNTITFSGHPMDPAFEAALAAAASAAGTSGKKEQRTLPPVTETLEELMQRPVKELRAMLDERGITYADCLEKGDLARRVVERCSNVTYHVAA